MRGVCGLTTQAQRRRPRGSPIATATARRRSLQRMVRRRLRVYIFRLHTFAMSVATAPRTNIARMPSMRFGGREGRNHVVTAPTQNIGASSNDTRTCPISNFLWRHDVTSATSTQAAPTANQPLHSNRMRESSFIRTFLPPNVQSSGTRDQMTRIPTQSGNRTGHPALPAAIC
jgi:hypothetical protein